MISIMFLRIPEDDDTWTSLNESLDSSTILRQLESQLESALEQNHLTSGVTQHFLDDCVHQLSSCIFDAFASHRLVGKRSFG